MEDDDARDVFGYIVLGAAVVLVLLGVLTSASDAVVRGLGAAIFTFVLASLAQLYWSRRAA